jgi:hypothetical protein
MESAQVTALRQTRQAATHAGLKKLSKALAGAKFAKQAQSGAVRFEENRTKVPKYRTQIFYRTEPVKTLMPVYEGREAPKSIAQGTQPLTGFDDAAAAGIVEGASFQVQVADAAPATISFGADRTITVKVGSAESKHVYGEDEGAFAATLVRALDNLSGLQATLDDDGQLRLETEKSTSLTLTESAYNPMGFLGLTGGRIELNGTGIEQVQVGTKLVQTGTKQVEISREYIRDGETEVVSGTHLVRDKISMADAQLTAASRMEIVTAALALDAAIGPKELARGIENPFTGLRNRVGLDRLKKASTRGDLGLSGMQIAVALKAYGSNPINTSATNKLI